MRSMGKTRKIDAGICNGRIFLNCLGVGFDGEVAREIPGVNWFSGKMKYYWVVIKKIISYRSKILQVAWKDGSMEWSHVYGHCCQWIQVWWRI